MQKNTVAVGALKRACASAPIGVFDSGVGGLSVLKHLRTLLPAEDFLYVADSAYAPYGARSHEFIRERSLYIANFLIEKGIKALVVACNTATAAAVHELRERLTIPVIAMEPGIKPAVEITKSNVVGVLATAGTLESARFFSLVNRYAGDVEIVTQPCAGLVERVEANDLTSMATLDLLRGYLEPLLARGADVIVLGCTHYPFLRKQIEELARKQIEELARKQIEELARRQIEELAREQIGKIVPNKIEKNLREQIENRYDNEIAIVDTGLAVATELKRRLELKSLLSERKNPGVENFWTSGVSPNSIDVFRQLWACPVRLELLD